MLRPTLDVRDAVANGADARTPSTHATPCTDVLGR
jgi:hypothetical protein